MWFCNVTIFKPSFNKVKGDGNFFLIENEKKISNKKVLLRERKRHTARCVASTRYVALCNGGGLETGYPPPDMGYSLNMGYPLTWGTPWTWGTPQTWGTLWTWGTPQTWDGVPPTQTWDGVPPLSRPEMGYPPPWDVNWQTNWKQYLPPSFGCGR